MKQLTTLISALLFLTLGVSHVWGASSFDDFDSKMEMVCQPNLVHRIADYTVRKEGNYIKLFNYRTPFSEGCVTGCYERKVSKILESDESGKRYIIRLFGKRHMIDFNNKKHYKNIDRNKNYLFCLGQ